VSAVFYQVKFYASGLSLVQSSSTECGMSECDRESRRPWPTRGCCAVKERPPNCTHLRDYKYNINEFNIPLRIVKQCDLQDNTLKNDTDLSDLRIYTQRHRQGAASQVRNQCVNGEQESVNTVIRILQTMYSRHGRSRSGSG
jgi:hypothetical protein